MPPEAYDTVPGLALARAMRSWTVRSAFELPTVNTKGTELMKPIPTKSFNGS